MSDRKTTRRAILGGVALAGIGLFAARGRIGDLLVPELAFEPMPGLPDFRRMAGGSSSGSALGGTFGMFVGLDADAEADRRFDAVVKAVRADLCPTLYPGRSGAPGQVPVASFSDYNCPYCRVQTEKLAEIARDGGIDVAWHELPLLGDASVTAAKGALAARRQGAYLDFHRRLMRAPFQTNREYLEVLARDIGVDPDRFAADMAGEEVAAEIERSRALGRIFGFVGTPALVVGRTVIQGEIGDATMRALIDRERADGAVAGCAA